MVVAQLSFALMGFIDAVLMGQLGVDALAGGGLGSIIYQFFYIVGIGILVATANFIAFAEGERNHAAIHTALLSGAVAVLAMCVVFGLAIWQIGPLLVWFGQPVHAVVNAQAYLDVVVWSLLPAFGFILLRGLVLGLGKPGAILPISIAATILNYPLSYALMTGWGGLPVMGIQGVALGTVIVSVFMFLGLAWLTYRQHLFQPFKFWVGWDHFSWHQLRQTFGLGIPIAIAHAMEIGMFAVAALLIGTLGVDALAAHQITLQCTTLSFMIPLGLAQAVSAQVGSAYGQRDFQRLLQVVRAGLALGTCTAAGAGFLFIALPELLTDLFIDRQSGADLQHVVRLAVSLLFVAALFQWVDAMQVILMGVLRGFKLGTAPTLVSVFSYWFVGVPACWLWLQGEGAWGVWAGMGLGLAVSSVLLGGLYVRVLRRTRNVATG
jgi:MATE family multidrug resistance protein